MSAPQSTSGFSMAQPSGFSAAAGLGSGGFSQTNAVGSFTGAASGGGPGTTQQTTGGFSLAQKSGLTTSAGGLSTILSPKCDISDIEEIRQAYAPLLSRNLPIPSEEYIEPGGSKQPNKSCELYCWLYSPINPNARSAHDMHDIQRREVIWSLKIYFFMLYNSDEVVYRLIKETPIRRIWNQKKLLEPQTSRDGLINSS